MQIFDRTWPQLKDFEHSFEFHFFKFFFEKKYSPQNEVSIKSAFRFFYSSSRAREYP